MPGLRAAALALLATFSLSTVAQTVIVSPNSEPGGAFGTTVSSIADQNGDGVRDVLVGAPGESVGLVQGAGRAYVLSGATRTGLLTLESPNPEQGGGFGLWLNPAGDLNADGRPDLIVGAPGEDVDGVVDAGRAYVFSGADGSVLYTLTSPTPTTNGQVGARVVRLGDTNGDQVNDFGVTASQDDPSSPPSGNAPGAVLVFSGADGSILSVKRGITPGDRFGSAIAGSDFDGDTLADLVVGVPSAFAETGEGSGLAVLYETGDPVQEVYDPPFPYDNQEFGVSLDTIGDRDGDGVAELLVGARDSVFVFSGATREVLFSVGSPEGTGGRFGLAVSGAGNVEEVGAADLIVGAPFERVDGPPSGRVYILSGDGGALIRSITSPSSEPNALFGLAVSLAGDVDDDNTADQIVGAPGEADGAGRAYLLLSATVVANESTRERALALTASPNPARGTLRLGAEAGGTLTVVDALGREVYRAEIRGATVLDVSAWTPGAYLVRLTTEAGVATRSVTVAR